MSRESRMLAGTLLVVLPTVMYGGLSLLFFLMRGAPGYADNSLLINLAYISAAFLAVAVLTLGVGLIRAARRSQP